MHDGTDATLQKNETQKRRCFGCLVRHRCNTAKKQRGNGVLDIGRGTDAALFSSLKKYEVQIVGAGKLESHYEKNILEKSAIWSALERATCVENG